MAHDGDRRGLSLGPLRRQGVEDLLGTRRELIRVDLEVDIPRQRSDRGIGLLRRGDRTVDRGDGEDDLDGYGELDHRHWPLHLVRGQGGARAHGGHEREGSSCYRAPPHRGHGVHSLVTGMPSKGATFGIVTVTAPTPSGSSLNVVKTVRDSPGSSEEASSSLHMQDLSAAFPGE